MIDRITATSTEIVAGLLATILMIVYFVFYLVVIIGFISIAIVLTPFALILWLYTLITRIC